MNADDGDMKGKERLIDEAWEKLNGGQRDAAEQLFTLASEQTPEDPDVWNGLGAVYFEQGDLQTSLSYYEKARDLALAASGGAWPERLSWTEGHKPALRALHGVGINLFRMGRTEAAERVLRTLLDLNPADNQGVRFLLDDIEHGSDPWKAGGPRKGKKP